MTFVDWLLSRAPAPGALEDSRPDYTVVVLAYDVRGVNRLRELQGRVALSSFAEILEDMVERAPRVDLLHALRALVEAADGYETETGLPVMVAGVDYLADDDILGRVLPVVRTKP